ncbi:MAG: NAD-dependent epimerase/dehydratase family protein [Actinomycetota bacterium]
MSRPASPVVVVTGAGGWLGQNLVRVLAADPGRTRIRALVHGADEAPLLEVLDPRIEVVVGDVRDPAVIDRLFADAVGATVVHAAGVIHPRRAVRECFDVNVGGTQLVVDRSRRARCGRLVHLSSNSPFGANRTPDGRFTEDAEYRPYMAYGRSKQEAEQIVRRAAMRGDVDAVVLRPPWFYGPFQPARQTSFFAAVRRGRFPVIAPGTQRRSMVYTGNLVDAVLAAEVADLEPGRALWVADAEPYPLGEIIDTVRSALEAEGVPVTGGRLPLVPRRIADLATRADAAIQATGRYVAAVHVLGELEDTIACDIGATREALGWEPRVGLLEGMRRSVRSCLERGLPL